ncbi:NADH-dependent FMN reductase RutF [Yersinia enterocolitica]|uniref:NADH-dependent FMN reductase RutF n=1 Tax=Yersinia enterocolitica TaxID=630 RepID=UPI0003D8F9E4|nr:pyrimidine utilization flavin reductase protein F [Yersinia enterocolitica]EKN3387361.1 pyrimidine utilization flavin reductase protein F [Yersinia enterocolitica]EKN3404466.1 pyrimidine utilization flavin reductase protein F [Yersinia enterocolitica]EKN3467258.1 pyrimidine utilization flavin reductase protein F [Yersinia enterocolitica]EKN3486856.1 pyrimidine utilization flavin reductase protein F [Yersinia enterocolitica]EKN3575667.1 pyrimidine utilization flavin reductase protein F [Yers
MQTQSLPTDSLPASSALRSVAVDKQDFRDAMARLGSAVNIITTDGPAGRAGFTASAVCSVTDTPPTLLVCLNRSASVYSVFQQNQTLCVNTLCADHESLSNLFGGKTPMEMRFSAARWSTLVTGSPVLSGAVASFDCHITQVISVGTHDILFCQAAAVIHSDDQHGLAYFDRCYHPLMRQSR